MMIAQAMTRRIGEPADDVIGRLLERTCTIAMIGASPERSRPSFGIMRYLQGAGYRVIPVNPHHAGEDLHGERVVGSLDEIDGPIDLVNVFRRAEAVGEAVDAAIGAQVPAIWIQLGIRNEAAAVRAEAAGLTVVMDRCISVEHSRLAGTLRAAGDR